MNVLLVTTALTLLTVANGAPPKWTTGPSCVFSCRNQSDGDYQSCFTCHAYISCSGGVTYRDRPCTGGTMWDDGLKRCEYTSSTCSYYNNEEERESADKSKEKDKSKEQDKSKEDKYKEIKVGQCIQNCKHVRNGYYHSCKGCNVYATCANGRIYDNRPCPSNLLWNDLIKRCDWESSTCPSKDNSKEDSSSKEEEIGEITDPSEITEPGVCVSSCSGVADGDYQSCLGCTVYATCHSGHLYDNRPCPEGLVWDDDKKYCDYTSGTCDTSSGDGIDPPRADCVSSCSDVADGDYQSCQGCSVYATCSGGYLYDNRACQPGLVWDDNLKYCDYSSSTCE